MRLIEKTVSLEKAENIFYIIEEVLRNNINTQVQVENSIMEELRKNKIKHNIRFSKLCRTNHYNTESERNGEKWYILNKKDIFSPSIAEASFVGNFSNYQQLVQYKSKKISNYKHFMVKFEQLLMIYMESDNLK